MGRYSEDHTMRPPRYWTGFGVTKTTHEWIADPRCVVGYRTLRTRLYKYRWPFELSLTPRDWLPEADADLDDGETLVESVHSFGETHETD